jgi:hypothetical protein
VKPGLFHSSRIANRRSFSMYYVWHDKGHSILVQANQDAAAELSVSGIDCSVLLAVR